MQKEFIDDLIEKQTQVQIYLRNGVKLTGKIIDQDAEAIKFDGPNATNMVYKDAISTIARPKNAT